MISDIQYIFSSAMSILKSNIVLYGYSFNLLDVFIFSFLACTVIALLFYILDV